jgi:hypothetical protein
MQPDLKRPRFRISLRTALVLFTVVCLAIGLLFQWRQRALQQRNLVLLLGSVYQNDVKFIYDFQSKDDLVRESLFSSSPTWWGRSWRLDFVHRLVEIRFFAPANSRHLVLESVPSIESLELHEGFAEASGWPLVFQNQNLKSLVLLPGRDLSLWNLTETSDKVNRLKNISKLSRLTDFHIDFSGMNRSEIEEILRHPALETIRLTGYQHHSELLGESLCHSQSIKSLFLYRNEANVESLKPLLEALPNLEFLAIEHAQTLLSSTLDDSIFDQIAKLKSLKQLFLHGSQIKGHQLEIIRHLPLERLGLGVSHLDDVGAAQLTLLEKVNYLEVGSTKITDVGLTSIANMSRLEYLSIRDTPTTDDGLAELTKLENLRMLRIRSTRLTDKGVQAFRRQRPMCVVEVW